MHKEIYENPLCGRYASKEMQRIFSPDNKFSTWRRLWVALAESEQELGLPITDEQIRELRAHITDIDYDYAAAREHEVRHDVMAHVLTYGACCPEAKPILHLGGTTSWRISTPTRSSVRLPRRSFILARRAALSATIPISCR